MGPLRLPGDPFTPALHVITEAMQRLTIEEEAEAESRKMQQIADQVGQVSQSISFNVPMDLIQIIAEYATEMGRAIRQGNDMEPFAGRIVAYQASLPYFTDSNYVFADSPGLLFAYIKKESMWGESTWGRSFIPQRGHKLYRLNLVDDQECYMYDETLQKDPTVRMRCATREELGKIAALIGSSEATFTCFSTTTIFPKEPCPHPPYVRREVPLPPDPSPPPPAHHGLVAVTTRRQCCVTQ